MVIAMSNVFLADKLSVFPILQQCVGLSTSLINIIKSIKTAATLHGFKGQFSRSVNGNQSLKDRMKDKNLEIAFLKEALDADFQSELNPLKFKSKESFIFLQQYVQNFVADQKLNEQGFSDADIKLITTILILEKALDRQLKYIGFGLVRATPIAGTVYGIATWIKGKSY